MTTRTLPLHLTKRAKRALMFNHSIPGVVLIITGVAALRGGWHEHSWIDLLGLVAGVLLVIALVRELKAEERHEHVKIAWFDVLAGIVITLEGYHKLHPGEWFQPGSVLMFVGVMLFFVGLFHAKLPHIRQLKCADEGFTMRLRPIYAISGKWASIQSIALDRNTLLIRKSDDSVKKHSLRKIENRDEVLRVLNEELAAYQSKLADTK
ncbi:MAG: hypothetical protein H6505_03530 [Calditrichaeota bacterium]|nr:hypothetical protein [Calditrichota bacterium]